MAKVLTSKKACTVNPLKMSQPIGGALAFMGVDAAMPLLHGSQGCTSFGLVLFVRHFREAIPLQTTAMSEVATVLGGFENVEQAVLTIAGKTKPALIGICSTGVTETKGDDVEGYIRLIRQRHPELDDIALVYVSTPDFKDAFQDGWAKTVTKMVDQLVLPTPDDALRLTNRVNLLPGCHVTPGDLDELRDILAGFGLEAMVLPDLSGSLDGHVPADFSPTTNGGITTAEIATMGRSCWTIAIGEQMRDAAQALRDCTGVPFRLFDRLTGLASCDALISFLAEISGKTVPAKLRRQRSQLVDAMLDGHFFFGGKRIAIGAEPDLLWSVGCWLAEMGCTISAAVTTTQSPMLARLPVDTVLIGDLEDLESNAHDCDLMITHSHGRQAAERLHKPLFRMGIPTFDRLGAGHLTSVGYRGTRNLVFELGNLFMRNRTKLTPIRGVIRTERQAMAIRRLRLIPAPSARAVWQQAGGSMKVAFATQDLKRVDAHFGWAKNIAIYEISPAGHAFVEAIQFDGDLQEDGNEDKLAPKIDAIKDCAILYVAAIGGSGAARVVAQNIHPMKVNQPEEISDLLVKLTDVLKGAPPPWLRKALLKGKERVLNFDEGV